MHDKLTGNRMFWLVVGVVVGVCMAYVWPRERAFASTADRDSQFAMATCPVGGVIGVTDQLDGVFVLDFLTGSLKGAALNRQARKFTAFYYRDLAKDFKVDPQAEPHYAFVSGTAQLGGAGGVTFAAGVLYVGELTSGKILCYAFPWQETNTPVPPVRIEPIDGFQFREPSQK